MPASACSTFEGLTIGPQSNETCGHAAVHPLRIDPAIPGGDQEFVVAVHHFDFGEAGSDGGSPMMHTIGFDLDGKCTGQGEGPSCQAPSWAEQFQDGVDGRDNAVSSVYVADDAGNPSQRAELLTKQAEVGLGTMLFRVQKYNGTPRDGEVEVALYGASRSPGQDGWESTEPWQVFVEWTIPTVGSDGGQFSSPFDARFRSARAYVSDGILVAYFESARGLPEQEFTRVWIQARIEDGVPGDGQWSLKDGIFAGRQNIDSALAIVEYSPDPVLNKTFTCMDSPNYPAVKRRACRLADINSSVDDGSAPCDAASWAWRFDADPALLAPDVNTTKAAEIRPCPPEQSPSNDRCNTLDVGSP